MFTSSIKCFGVQISNTVWFGLAVVYSSKLVHRVVWWLVLGVPACTLGLKVMSVTFAWSPCGAATMTLYPDINQLKNLKPCAVREHPV